MDAETVIVSIRRDWPVLTLMAMDTLASVLALITR